MQALHDKWLSASFSESVWMQEAAEHGFIASVQPDDNVLPESQLTSPASMQPSSRAHTSGSSPGGLLGVQRVRRPTLHACCV